jgi:hypothetical protein
VQNKKKRCFLMGVWGGCHEMAASLYFKGKNGLIKK